MRVDCHFFLLLLLLVFLCIPQLFNELSLCETNSGFLGACAMPLFNVHMNAIAAHRFVMAMLFVVSFCYVYILPIKYLLSRLRLSTSVVHASHTICQQPGWCSIRSNLVPTVKHIYGISLLNASTLCFIVWRKMNTFIVSQWPNINFI